MSGLYCHMRLQVSEGIVPHGLASREVASAVWGMCVRRWPILIVGEMSTMTNWVRAKFLRPTRAACVSLGSVGK